MPYDPARHHRRSIRLRGYDYTVQGAYYVTICIHGRQCLLGDVVGGAVRLSDYGRIVTACWDAIPDHFSGVELDAFVVMPDHVHGIVVIATDPPAPATGGQPTGPPKRSLGAIVGSFKAAAARQINQLRGTAGAPFWQRNYYEHIVRDSADLDRIRAYIECNPARWLGAKQRRAR